MSSRGFRGSVVDDIISVFHLITFNLTMNPENTRLTEDAEDHGTLTSCENNLPFYEGKKLDLSDSSSSQSDSVSRLPFKASANGFCL